MGSGLILLVIVGAWLAVLVPMALRSHDASTSLSSVERFSDAMRVLSRREASVRRQARSVVMPARPAPPTGALALPLDRAALAARRLRVLLVLTGLTAVSLLGTVAGATWCVLLAVVFAGLTTAYVLYLRRLELRRRERAHRRPVQPRRRRAAPQRIAGIPDRMPARPDQPALVPVAPAAAAPAPAAAAPAPAAARYEELPLAPDTWTSPEFPVPTYVNAPLAPPRVVDLTRPGAWSDAMDPGRSIVGTTEGEDALDAALHDELNDILDRRRASGDW